MITLLVCTTIFSSCSPEEILDKLFGEIQFTVSESTEETAYANNEIVKFKSSLTDMASLDSNSLNNIYIGATIELTQADAVIAPYCGFQLVDTVATRYPISLPISIEEFAQFNAENILTSMMDTNVFIMAVNDTSWYVGYDGTIIVEEYPNYGYLATGSFEDIKAFYITKTDVDYIKDLVNRSMEGDIEAIDLLATLTPNNIFPSITLNGSYSSRRANISGLLESLRD